MALIRSGGMDKHDIVGQRRSLLEWDCCRPEGQAGKGAVSKDQGAKSQKHLGLPCLCVTGAARGTMEHAWETSLAGGLEPLMSNKTQAPTRNSTAGDFPTFHAHASPPRPQKGCADAATSSLERILIDLVSAAQTSFFTIFLGISFSLVPVSLC